MADKKDSPPKDLYVEVGFILLVIGSIWFLWSMILNYLAAQSHFGSVGAVLEALWHWAREHLYPVLIALSILFTTLMIVGIFVNYRKILALNKEEAKIYRLPKTEDIDDLVPLKKNERWDKVSAHINSTNPADWRLAIIEADLILDEMLRAQGYIGDSIGDMLKAVERSDMLTIDHAWEAHKIRNEVVHSGSEYQLTEREARRIISLYESVFREFEMI